MAAISKPVSSLTKRSGGGDRWLALLGASLLLAAGYQLFTSSRRKPTVLDPYATQQPTWIRSSVNPSALPSATTTSIQNGYPLPQVGSRRNPDDLVNSTALELVLQETTNDFVIRFERQQIYNPTLLVADDGTLVMYTRFEGRNSIGRWKSCPTTSLYRAQDCPVPDMRMISFLATCRLDPATLQCM